MKPRLVLLSDLWGKGRSDWWQNYDQLLAPHFNLQWYDCCALAGLQLVPYEQEHLHRQFVAGGIERAVQALIQHESTRSSPCYILGFSIGGLIGWRSIVAGLRANYFCAISATRLRYETHVLPLNGLLLYGKEDPYQPAPEWLDKQQLQHQVLADFRHECYQESAIAEQIAQELIGSI